MVQAMTGWQEVSFPLPYRALAAPTRLARWPARSQVFKTSMIETERLRAEQLEMEQRQLQQRKADMHELADEFEGAVGEIVEMVSSAATELEASANTLTTTARSRRSSQPRSRRHPRKLRPMCSRWLPRAKR